MTCGDVSLLICQWLSVLAHFIPIAYLIGIASSSLDGLFCNMSSVFIILITATVIHFIILLTSTIMYIVLKNKKSDKFINYSLIIASITSILDVCLCGILLFNYFGGYICISQLVLAIIIFTVYCASSSLIFICTCCHFIIFHKCMRKRTVAPDIEVLLESNDN